MKHVDIRIVVGLAALVGVTSERAIAQDPKACETILRKQPGLVSETFDNPCVSLATFIITANSQIRAAASVILQDDAVPVGTVFNQRDLQARNPQQASLAGTPAQGQAIPSVQPAGVAAGTIAAVGTDGGNDAIAALGLNPAILFIGDEVSRRLAQYSRFADLTVFVPVSRLTNDADTSEDHKPRYFGARLRLNIVGISSGNDVWNGARALITNWISRAGRNQEHVISALATAPSLEGCADALIANNPVATQTNCGKAITLEVNPEEAEQLRTQLARVRHAADARYFGADVRFDTGDPTMGAVENASGTFLFAGLSYGRRLAGDAAASYGARLRLGARHAKLDKVAESEFAVEGGVGFDLARRLDNQEINASAALEFRYGNADSDLTDRFQSNFVMARGSFLLPITSGNSLSINIGSPIAGDVSPILSVNFNWGLLMPATSN